MSLFQTTPATSTPPSGATSFVDEAGRTWILALNVGNSNRLFRDHGIDLARIQDPRPLLKIVEDPYNFAAALWTLCESQAVAAGVSPEAFAEALGGPAMDTALTALVEATIQLQPASKRGALRAIIEKVFKAQSDGMAAVEKWADESGPKISQKIVDLAKAELAKVDLGEAK
jgi:hypothetical protein